MDKLLSIHNLLINFKQDTGLSVQNMRSTIIRWVVDGEFHIGGGVHPIKYYKTRSMGNFIKLPDDAVGVMPMILKGHIDCPEKENFGELYNSGIATAWYGTRAPSTNLQYWNGYQYGFTNFKPYNGGVLLDCTCLCDKDVTVAYFGTELDCDGFPMIRRTHFESIGYFLKKKQSERMMLDPATKKVAMNVVQWFSQEWERNTADARAMDGEMTHAQKQRLVFQVNFPLSGVDSIYWLYDE